VDTPEFHLCIDAGAKAKLPWEQARFKDRPDHQNYRHLRYSIPDTRDAKRALAIHSQRAAICAASTVGSSKDIFATYLTV